MITHIKKIDLQGNVVLQEIVVCNRCKKILEPKEYMYTLRLTAAHPVKIEPGCAYGLSKNDPWHFCEDCYPEVCRTLDGEINVKATAHWTGPQLEDYANFTDSTNRLAVAIRSETLKHVRHCSHCNTRFDNCNIQQWKCCPVCEAVIEKKPDMFITIHKP